MVSDGYGWALESWARNGMAMCTVRGLPRRLSLSLCVRSVCGVGCVASLRLLPLEVANFYSCCVEPR